MSHNPPKRVSLLTALFESEGERDTSTTFNGGTVRFLIENDYTIPEEGSRDYTVQYMMSPGLYATLDHNNLAGGVDEYCKDHKGQWSSDEDTADAQVRDLVHSALARTLSELNYRGVEVIFAEGEEEADFEDHRDVPLDVDCEGDDESGATGPRTSVNFVNEWKPVPEYSGGCMSVTTHGWPISSIPASARVLERRYIARR